jgi:hypothetical protein
LALRSQNPISLLQSVVKSRSALVRKKALKSKEFTTDVSSNTNLGENGLAGDVERRATTCLNVERRKSQFLEEETGCPE